MSHFVHVPSMLILLASDSKFSLNHVFHSLSDCKDHFWSKPMWEFCLKLFIYMSVPSQNLKTSFKFHGFTFCEWVWKFDVHSDSLWKAGHLIIMQVVSIVYYHLKGQMVWAWFGQHSQCISDMKWTLLKHPSTIRRYTTNLSRSFIENHLSYYKVPKLFIYIYICMRRIADKVTT